MQITSLHTKCIFFLAVFKLCDSRHEKADAELPPKEVTLPENENIDCVCTTPGCVKTACNVLSFLEETVNPCDNFYQFACGGWLNRHYIPEEQTEVTTFSEVQNDVFLKLKALIERELDGTEPRFVKMLKDVYDACMDLENIEKLGSDPLRKDLESLGGWPVVEGSMWDNFRFDWVDTLIAFRRLGYGHNMLMTLSAVVDNRNNTVHIIKLDQASLGMPHREYFISGLNDSATAAYYKLMVKEAVLLGADENTANEELLEALKFEIELAKISSTKEERRNFSRIYNKYTVAELQNTIPQIPWLRYFNGLLNDEISETENIVVAEPEFVKALVNLLENTEKRVVANYMFFRVVDESSSLLSKEWRNNHQEYKSVLKGQSKEEQRWETCIFTWNLMIALSSYYVRHHFGKDSIDRIIELKENIHKAFINILEDSEWMSDVTKKHAIAKANSMKAFLGYPKELLNDTAVIEVYENLTINNRSYYENSKNIDKWAKDNKFSKLRKLTSEGEWKKHSSAIAVNAYYSLEENSIDIPAGILQSIFFGKDRPQYMNFGGIGFVIGHEITHLFDDGGKQFDKDGNNVNWWDETTDKHYNERAQCMIEQYGNYTAENGMKVNGVLTLGENIADNGGLKEAYKGYNLWVEKNGPEPLLPGLNYTQKQLFWINVASIFCTKTRPEQLKAHILSNSHSPGEFRVIGPMSNLPEFLEDFNCSPDSPMNIIDKCQVW